MPPIVRIDCHRLLPPRSAATSTAFAQDFASLYSSTATRKCKQVDAAKNGEGDWTIWLCPGIGGKVVLRDRGRPAHDGVDRARPQIRRRRTGVEAPVLTFNSVHDTLEWRTTEGRAVRDHPALVPVGLGRIPARTGRPTPVAMMVVTRLNPACHVAYVDVRANAIANANVVARQAADEHARDFDCNNQPMVIGKRGRAIELAMP